MKLALPFFLTGKTDTNTKERLLSQFLCKTMFGPKGKTYMQYMYSMYTLFKNHNSVLRAFLFLFSVHFNHLCGTYIYVIYLCSMSLLCLHVRCLFIPAFPVIIYPAVLQGIRLLWISLVRPLTCEECGSITMYTIQIARGHYL